MHGTAADATIFAYSIWKSAGADETARGNRANATIREDGIMACCEICGKGASTGHQISHSDKKSKRQWKPNLQKVTVRKNGNTRKLLVCTKCIKAGKVERLQ